MLKISRGLPSFKNCINMNRSFASHLTAKDIQTLEERYTQPIQFFKSLLRDAAFLLQSPEVTRYNLKHHTLRYVQNGIVRNVWHADLEVNWPEHFKVEGIGSSKSEATKIAHLLACEKIKSLAGDPQIIKKKKESLIAEALTAKAHINNIYALVSKTKNMPELTPVFQSQPLEGIAGWNSKLTLRWPELMTFLGLGGNKTTAENMASHLALEHLKQIGAISRQLHPILISSQEIKAFKWQQSQATALTLDPNLKEQIKNLYSHFQALKPHLKQEAMPLPEKKSQDEAIDIFTDRPYEDPDPSYEENRRLALKYFFENNADGSVMWRRQIQQALPIFSKKKEILRMIDKHQVVLITGDTGCGKTTQMPQYLLEAGLNNVVITQPRRISTLTVAAQVAEELGQPLGQTVGYHIRLDKLLPLESRGALLFCSTGILLRHLQVNKSLKGVTHIIVDEIHERDVQIDFLLTLLREQMKLNPKLRVILMSASFDHQVLSSYFNNCPIITISGRNFHVKSHFLPEVLQMVGEDYYEECQGFTEMTKNLICRLIHHIDRNNPPGAILCFLPGWNEIKWVHDTLLEQDHDDRLILCPCHSRLSSYDQLKMFAPATEGKRKVILATNIAESSLTIEDIVYVVDPGLHKETSLDVESGLSSLQTRWISKASALQRKGRAGRVRPGEIYHLYSKETMQSFERFATPEILRVPLESVVLDAKAFSPDSSVQGFLNSTPQVPSRNAIQKAIEDLQDLNILTKDEKLTPLGEIVSKLPIHPRLSKAIIFSLFFNCLDSILTIASSLSVAKDIFLTTLDNRNEIKEAKLKLCNTHLSDHILLDVAHQKWKKALICNNSKNFCDEHLLNETSMAFIEGLKNMFLENLENLHYTSAFREMELMSSSENTSLILATLAAAFYPNVLRCQRGIVKKFRLDQNAMTAMTIKGQPTHLAKDMLACATKEESVVFTPQWLTFFNIVNSPERSSLVVSDGSFVSPWALAVLTGEHWLVLPDYSNPGRESALVLQSPKYQNLKFSCTSQEADAVFQLQDCFTHLMDHFLQTLSSSSPSMNSDFKNVHSNFLKLLSELTKLDLNDSSSPDSVETSPHPLPNDS